MRKRTFESVALTDEPPQPLNRIAVELVELGRRVATAKVAAPAGQKPVQVGYDVLDRKPQQPPVGQLANPQPGRLRGGRRRPACQENSAPACSSSPPSGGGTPERRRSPHHRCPDTQAASSPRPAGAETGEQRSQLGHRCLGLRPGSAQDDEVIAIPDQHTEPAVIALPTPGRARSDRRWPATVRSANLAASRPQGAAGFPLPAPRLSASFATASSTRRSEIRSHTTTSRGSADRARQRSRECRRRSPTASRASPHA